MEKLKISPIWRIGDRVFPTYQDAQDYLNLRYFGSDYCWMILADCPTDFGRDDA